MLAAFFDARTRMFIGHFGASLAAKAAAPRIPLWQLVLATQALDILWAVCVWLGLEHAAIDLALPSNPLTRGDIRYTHSLLGAAVWSLLFGALAAKVAPASEKRRTFVAVALVVASHWFLDLIVHRPDLPILPGMPGLGFALWDRPAAAFWTEAMLVVAGSALLLWRTPPAQRAPFAGFCALLLALHASTWVVPPPPWLTALTITMLATIAVITAAAVWTERIAQRRAQLLG